MNTLVLATFEDRDSSHRLPVVVGIVLGPVLNFVITCACLGVIEFDLAFISRSKSILQIWRIIRLFCLRADNFNKQCLLYFDGVCNDKRGLSVGTQLLPKEANHLNKRTSKFKLSRANHKLVIFLPLSMASIGPRGTVSSDILPRFSHEVLLYINSCFSVKFVSDLQSVNFARL